MNEIYWITRLDTLQVFLIIFTVIFTVLSIISFIIIKMEDVNSEVLKSNKKSLRISFPLCILFIIATVLIPSTKEAYQIYGIGGTIDYIKQNKEIKKLPDKAVKALNLFLDKEISEQRQDSIDRNNCNN